MRLSYKKFTKMSNNVKFFAVRYYFHFVYDTLLP